MMTLKEQICFVYPEYEGELDSHPESVLREIFPEIALYGTALPEIEKLYSDTESLIRGFPYNSLGQAGMFRAFREAQEEKRWESPFKFSQLQKVSTHTLFGDRMKVQHLSKETLKAVHKKQDELMTLTYWNRGSRTTPEITEIQLTVTLISKILVRCIAFLSDPESTRLAKNAVIVSAGKKLMADWEELVANPGWVRQNSSNETSLPEHLEVNHA